MSDGMLRGEFEASDRSIASRHYGLVFATHFRSGVTAEAMNEYSRWSGTQLDNGEQLVSLTLLTSAERIPDGVREATNRYMAEYGPHTRASATVVAARGFMGSAARAMASTFYLVTRAGFPRKVFAELDPAGQYLEPYVDDQTALANSLEFLRGFMSEVV